MTLSVGYISNQIQVCTLRTTEQSINSLDSLSHLEMNSTRPRKKGRSRLAEPRAKNTDMDDDMPVGEYAQLELF